MADMTTVTIGGVKYSVTKAMADKIEEERKANAEKEKKTSLKLEELEAQVRDIAQRTTENRQDVKSVTDGLDYGRLAKDFWENPEKTLKEFGEGIEKRVTEKYNKAEAAKEEAKEAEDALKEFYKDFYIKNDHLKGEEDLVEAILGANWQKWKGLSRGEVMEKLEKSVTAVILRHSKAKQEDDKEDDKKGGQEFLVEGQSLESIDKGAEDEKEDEDKDEDEKPDSLSKVLKQRRAARRQQAQGKT